MKLQDEAMTRDKAIKRVTDIYVCVKVKIRGEMMTAQMKRAWPRNYEECQADGKKQGHERKRAETAKTIKDEKCKYEEERN